ncbi:hypothetical protein D1007_10133 [Hordeum vulgare]|nr:hypothetical protein D1007_10133 [Hordeum vulgare]
MEKALAKLWDMYEESKAARTTENLESSFLIHNLTEEKKKLEENYEKLNGDVNDLLDQQHRVVNSVEQNNLKAELSNKVKDNTNLQQKYDINKNLTAAQAKVIRNFKNNHLKEKERLTEERHKLQHHISELQKSEEKMKLGVAATVVVLLVDATDVLLALLAGALEVPAATVEALLVVAADVMLSQLAGALEVPAASVEALLVVTGGVLDGAVGGVPTDEAAALALLVGAPTDEAASVALLVGVAIEEDAGTDEAASVDVVP